MENIDNGHDFARMESALQWLADNYEQQPSLKDTALSCGLSEFHFQRIFTRWVGLSPKKYIQYLTLNRAKQSLDEHRSILDATYEAGLSSPGRLHDLFISIESMTPGEYKSCGEGLRIHYGFHETLFSECLLMTTERGICAIGFHAEGGREATLARMQEGYENAEWLHDQALTGEHVKSAFGDPTRPRSQPLKLLLRGTKFEVKVWEALLTIPTGAVTNYADLAQRIGHPGSARAVGRAVAKNSIAYLIPCHRVIRKSGLLGGYRWGTGRKLAMLTREHLSAPALTN